MIKKIDRFELVGVFLLVSFILSSCGYTKKDAYRYLPGQYYYQIPSGEIQELKINPDFTFKQILYSKSRKGILYENTGKMSVDGQDIFFIHWLEFYEPLEPKMLIIPRTTNSGGIIWRKPKGNEGVLIIFFDQDQYIFRKVNTGISK
jgi:hypothetical protein